MTKPQLLAPLVLLAVLTGCDGLDNCPEGSSTPVVIDSGTTHADSLIYESSSWDKALVHFPPKTLLRFKHDLGTRPEIVTTYVSFSEHGLGESNVTENTGNQGLIVCVDANEIDIVNDTCEEDFYVRVTAYATGEGSTEAVCPRPKDLD